MLDIGWTELLVIGIIALIVVGPKDLPMMFRTLGQFTAKARGMAREFQRAMDDAAEQTGVKDVASDLRKATSAKEMGLDGLDKLRKTRPKDFLRDRDEDRSKSDDKSADADTTAAASTEEAADTADALDTAAADMDRMRNTRAAAGVSARSRAGSAARHETPPAQSDAPREDAGAGTGTRERKTDT